MGKRDDFRGRATPWRVATESLRPWLGSAAVLLIMSAALVAGAASDDKLAFLKVSPLAGETKTTKSGGKGLIRAASTTPQNTSKSVSRNMKWNCEVRYRGKGLPEEVEVRVFYIGYEGTEMKAKILGKDTKKLKLDENGKVSVELESPTVTLSKSRTTSSSGHSGTGHIAKTKTTVRGKRMAGCVVQLWEAGELVKSYASMSTWDNAAKDKNFSDESLNKKEKNRLN